MAAETFGARLAQVREIRGLSQPDLAALTGLKVQNISRFETAAREHVRSDTLVRLAHALDVSTDYLLGLSDHLQLGHRRRTPHGDAHGQGPARRARLKTGTTTRTIEKWREQICTLLVGRPEGLTDMEIHYGINAKLDIDGVLRLMVQEGVLACEERGGSPY